jgi:hypothetical protein
VLENSNLHHGRFDNPAPKRRRLSMCKVLICSHYFCFVNVQTEVHQSVCLFLYCRARASPERPSRIGLTKNCMGVSRIQIAETWLRITADMYCDIQPDESHIHLPFGHKQDVYNLYARLFVFCSPWIHSFNILIFFIYI